MRLIGLYLKSDDIKNLSKSYSINILNYNIKYVLYNGKYKIVVRNINSSRFFGTSGISFGSGNVDFGIDGQGKSNLKVGSFNFGDVLGEPITIPNLPEDPISVEYGNSGLIDIKQKVEDVLSLFQDFITTGDQISDGTKLYQIPIITDLISQENPPFW